MAGGKKIEIIKGSSDASPDMRRPRHPQAGRAGQGPDPGRPALGRRRHRGQGLRQDPARRDLHQRHVGARRTRRCAIRRRTSSASPPTARSGWPASATTPSTTRGYKKVATDRRGLLLPVHAGVRLHGRLCKAGGKVTHKVLGAARQQGLLLGHRQLPTDVDAIYVALGGADAVNFLTPVPAGRRRQADDRRLDHGRPDGAQLQGQAARRRCSARLGRPDRRHASTRRTGRSSSPTTRRPSRTASRARRCSPTATTST